MAADDVKPWVDILVTLLTGGGLGGIVLAFLGWMRAKHERPDHIAPPNVGATAMGQIAGMVMGQQSVTDMIDALRAIASAQDRCTLVREQEIRLYRDISDVRHREMRALNDHLDTLNDRLKAIPGG